MIKAVRHVYGENTSSFLYSLMSVVNFIGAFVVGFCWLHDVGCILDYTFCFLSGALPTLCNRGRMFIVVFQYYDYNFLSFFKRT